jgi:hypothetical protein
MDVKFQIYLLLSKALRFDFLQHMPAPSCSELSHMSVSFKICDTLFGIFNLIFTWSKTKTPWLLVS